MSPSFCCMTGAGWGGCTVSMVCDDDVEAFVEALKNDYYAKAVEGGRAKAEEVDRAIFVSKPSSGGAILRNIGYEKASST